MITPINGGQIKVSPVPLPTTNGLYSPQYIKAKRLELRPTEWVPGGRPIYKRLPLAGQTYQVSFENDGEIGYVYISSGSKSVGAGIGGIYRIVWYCAGEWHGIGHVFQPTRARWSIDR